MRLLISLAGSLLLLCNPAYAWKIETHLMLADALHQEVQQTGAVSIAPFGSTSLRPDLAQAISNNRGAFLLGVLGPDTYPDMVAGQMTAHPGVEADAPHQDAVVLLNLLGRNTGPHSSWRAADSWQTDDWLRHVRNSAYSITGSGGPPSKAFAIGYMAHAAMDTWAHTYVNLYAGDEFSLVDEQEVEFRHMAIEGLVARTHTSLFPATTITQRQALGQARDAFRSPQGLNQQKTDILSGLDAPVPFIRNALVLDAQVAAQYAREPLTLHLFAMYLYWSEVDRLRNRLQPVRDVLNTAAANAQQAVNAAAPAVAAAQTAHESAVAAANNAYRQFQDAEQNALKAANALEAAKNDALNYIDELTEGLIALLPPFVKSAYLNARAAADIADAALQTAKQHHENLISIRDARQAELYQAAAALDLHQSALDAIDATRSQTLGFVEQGVLSWRAGIESAIDAYIRAWQETSKELMRPSATRFSSGGDVTEPLKQWVVCWAPTFGLPVLSSISPVCDQARSSYVAVKTNLENIANNALLHESIRSAIEAFDDQVDRTSGVVLVEVAKLISRTIRIDNGALAGYARSIVNIRSHDPTLPEINEQFATDQSGKNLMMFPNVTALIAQDMGVTPGNRDKSVGELMTTFAALHNAQTMSKLTLLNGPQLNTVKPANIKLQAMYPGHGEHLLPGAVLIGALRSIDGDHQWQRYAPPLPRSGPYNWGSSPREFGYYSAASDEKPGLKLWHEPFRNVIFNAIFKGPLAPGLVEHAGIHALAIGIGICTADPYPPTEGPDACRPQPAGVGPSMPVRTQLQRRP